MRRTIVLLVTAMTLAACVPWYDGSAESFYQLPADATPQPPGTLVRVQEMAGQSNATTTVYRVMYWTKDRRDRPARATGAVRVPKAAPPAQGTTIAAWDHGTTGVAPQCAPSRTGASYPSAFLPTDVPVAIPDYIGLGPVGEMHAWLAGVSEARATIDLIRATKVLPNVRSNGTWWVAGHSQGGHAALFAAEEAAGYAPELQLRGVVAVAPGTELNEPVYVQNPYRPPHHRPLWRLRHCHNYMKPASIMVAAGLALDYPEIHLADYLTPDAESKLGVLQTGCLNEIIATYLGVTPLVDVDPWTNQRFVDLLVDNEPGWGPNPVPVLVLQGGQDPIVLPAYTQEYVQRACTQGTRVKLSVYPTADHNSIVGQAADEARQWLAAVASGQTPPTSC